MTSKYMRVLAIRLVALLPDLPQPWDIDVMCRDLARARGRRLTVQPANLPALPSGVWFDDGTCDRIIYRTLATGYYRDHIILHEICHMLAGHGTPLPEMAAGWRQDSCGMLDRTLRVPKSISTLRGSKMPPWGLTCRFTRLAHTR